MIKNFNLFKESVDEESKIRKICKEYGIKNYTINDDSSIDVDGDVDLSSKKLDKSPLKFNKINGNFYIHYNNLKSLEDCPKWVGGNFYCSYNELISLEFCPEYVSGDFSCRINKLTSLEYSPKWIGGDINCDGNKIWNFRYIPNSFSGYLFCKGNPIQNIWELFESSKDIEFFNDCDIIRYPSRKNPIIVLERLNFFLETIGKPTVEKVDGYINI
jgi:hypothetical protein